MPTCPRPAPADLPKPGALVVYDFRCHACWPSRATLQAHKRGHVSVSVTESWPWMPFLLSATACRATARSVRPNSRAQTPTGPGSKPSKARHCCQGLCHHLPHLCFKGGACPQTWPRFKPSYTAASFAIPGVRRPRQKPELEARIVLFASCRCAHQFTTRMCLTAMHLHPQQNGST